MNTRVMWHYALTVGASYVDVRGRDDGTVEERVWRERPSRAETDFPVDDPRCVTVLYRSHAAWVGAFAGRLRFSEISRATVDAGLRLIEISSVDEDRRAHE